MSRPIRILELRSVRGTGGGPEKTILLGAARAIPSRFAITVCYLRDARDPGFRIDTAAQQFPGVDYVEIRERHSVDVAIWPALRQLVRSRGIDIVHAHDYKTDLLALLLARTERVVPLATAHGWTGHSRRERHFYYPADKRLLARFPLVIAVSSQIRNQLLRVGAAPGRVQTILNGIDHRTFRRHRQQEHEIRLSLGLTPDDVVIGSVGRLEPQKRFDLLLKAFAILRARNERVRLVIAGEGGSRPALQALAAYLPSGACRLLGHRSDVARIHHAFDVFVQTSDYEGTPNAVLEAMALETPVVATDVGGTRELVAHGIHGLIVPPGGATALASAIDETLADRDATVRRAQAARDRVEGALSFDARIAAVEAIYERLAGLRPPGAERRDALQCA